MLGDSVDSNETQENSPDAPGVWIVVPAWNEQTRIESVVSSLLKSYSQNVLVVDDGSSDETSQVSAEAGAVVVRHPMNRGQGAALQTGFAFAMRQDADVVVTFDGDGQHDEDDISRLIDPILRGKCDVVLGSRFSGRSIGMPKLRLFVLKLAVLFTRVTTGLKLSDTHNGLRAFSRKAIKKIEITEDRMAHASDLLHQISIHQLSYQECPVTIRYDQETLEKGQRSSAAFGILTRLFLNRFIGS